MMVVCNVCDKIIPYTIYQDIFMYQTIFSFECHGENDSIRISTVQEYEFIEKHTRETKAAIYRRFVIYRELQKEYDQPINEMGKHFKAGISDPTILHMMHEENESKCLVVFTKKLQNSSNNF